MAGARQRSYMWGLKHLVRLYVGAIINRPAIQWKFFDNLWAIINRPRYSRSSSVPFQKDSPTPAQIHCICNMYGALQHFYNNHKQKWNGH